ncbi:erythromycin esterase family protein [Nocardia terpenica]|uniref:erythromycin esterase family protein n=1 Tax=Nocardia terpenica TaxID=455432 RepID=UPI002FE2982C
MADNTMTDAARLGTDAVHPIALDPEAPLTDLEWLDDAIGDARVVAIGESAHYNHEHYRLRQRMLRYLVERHGFSAYVLESGFTEAWTVDEWIHGGHQPLGTVLATGTTSLMGLWTEARAHLSWMRRHNETAATPVDFRGLDLSGSNVSLLPSLDYVIAYLAKADPDFRVDPAVRDTAAEFAAPSAFSYPAMLPAYTGLDPARRDALTAGLAALAVRFSALRLDYARRTSAEDYRRALHALQLTITLDAFARTLIRGDQRELLSMRDAAQADTVDWILRREGRILVAAHNGHIHRQTTVYAPGMEPATPLGLHLADRLGDDYLVIGATSGSGRTLNSGSDFYTGTLFTDLEPPRPGSLDALMHASHDEPFLTDLRTLSAADTAAVRAATEQRLGPNYYPVRPLDAFDLVVHLPRVTEATPDAEAIAASPEDVRRAFGHWANH